MKLAIIVRKDLKMSAGKVAGQVGHASVMSYKFSNEDTKNGWYYEGQKKIVLKVSNEEELVSLSQIALAKKLEVYFVRDMGLTQIEPNTLTCIAIGPDNDDKIDNVIKDLKLY